MSQRAMIVTALLAAFALVIVGGVAARLSTPDPGLPKDAVAQSRGAPQPTARAEPAADTETPAVVTAPDAGASDELRAVVAEANRRIAQQQRALDEARARLSGARAAPPARPAPRSNGERYEHEDERYEHERHEHEHEHEREDDD